MPKRVYFGDYLKTGKCGQTVLPDRSILIGQKLVEKSHKSKIQMRHFDLFSNNVGINEKWVGCQVREG